MSRRFLKSFLLGLIGALVIALAPCLFTATNATTRFYYSVTNLGILDTSGAPFSIISSNAVALNDAGDVIGSLRADTGATLPFLWRNGTMQGIGYKNTNVYGINNTGQVAGEILTGTTPIGAPVGPIHASLWNSSNTIPHPPNHPNPIDLGTLDGYGGSSPGGINNVGQVVGYVFNRSEYSCSGETRAFLWSNGTMTDLGTLNGYENSRAFAINEVGQVVGCASTSSNSSPGSTHAFLWSNAMMTDLGILDGYSNSDAFAINDRGRVVGQSYITISDIGNIGHAFSWKNGTMTDLGTLGGSNSSGYGINNRGRIVGSSQISSGSYHAFIWANGTMRDLNTLLLANSGWELTEARDINNNGQIVGEGYFNGQPRAFLLTPTWETF